MVNTMIGRSLLHPLGAPSLHGARNVPGKFLLFPLLGLLALVALQTPAHAQLTAKTILEPIVDQYGPQYQDVDTAIEAIRNGRLQDAMEALRQARQKNPELPPANLLLAQILFRSNQVDAGRSALEQAVKEDPQDPGAYVYLAEIALQSRQWAEADLLYNKALELVNNYSANEKRKNRLLTNIYGGLAQLAEFEEDWAQARDYLERLLQTDSDNVVAMTRLGRVLFKMATDRKGEEAAFAVFKKLHSVSPDNTAYPDVNMALLYEQAGKRENAKKLMERAAKNDSQNIRTRLAVAKWALDTGNLDMAKENAEAALRLDPTSLDAKLYVGLVARFNNDLGTAERAFEQAHLESPTHLGAMTQLALVLADQGDEQKQRLALDYARLNAQLYKDLKQPSGREAAITYAWVLSRMGQNANAVRTIQQALRNGSVSSDSAYHAAQILYDAGLNDAARQVLEQALRGDAVFPNRSAAEQLLARLRNF